MMSGVGLHKKLEENTGLLIFGILFVSAIGGLVQVLPSIFQESLQTATENTSLDRYIPLNHKMRYIRKAKIINPVPPMQKGVLQTFSLVW